MPSRAASPAACAAVLLCLAAGCRQPAQWNVLLVTFDTTRADFLGPYGRASAHTPALDRLAARGIVFERCYSAAPLTMPSHATIMTGTYPPRHGVRDNSLFALPDEASTLAEILSAEGYRTGAAVGSFVLDGQFGIGQGFDYFNDEVGQTYEDFRGRRVVEKEGLFFDERPASHVNEAILPWLRDEPGRPFLAWIHYWDPHEPHIPPAPYRYQFANDLYAGEIANADAAFGRVLDELEALGALETTVIVMTADHGEGRGQHEERTHATLCYDATLHVPLIVSVPGRPGGRRVASAVGTVDILPTILELLGLPAPAGVQGRSLVPELTGAPSRARTSYYAETLAPAIDFGLGELRAWRRGPYKYIHGPRPELFDVDADPEELHDLVADEAELAADLEQQLADFLAAEPGELAVKATHAADEATLLRLEALGYLTGAGVAPESLAEVLREGGKPPQDWVGDLGRFSGLKKALAENDFPQARELALLLLADDPGNEHYTAMLATAELGLGNQDEALRLIDEVDVPPRGLTRLYHGLAVRLAAEDEERALGLVDKVLAYEPTAAGHLLRSELLSRLGRGDAARAALEDALAADPGHVPARLDLAVALAGRGEPGRAESEFRTALEHNPLYPRSHFNYGKLLVDGGRFAEAESRFARAIELDRTYCKAYLGLITAQMARERLPAALATFDELQVACPDSEATGAAFDLLLGS